MFSLLLGVKRGPWRNENESLHEDKVYIDARSKVIARDQSTCKACGWQADRFQEAHHIDDDHTNNDVSNLVTLCAWCHRCHHIGLAGQYELGYIGIPPSRDTKWISQAEINQSTRMYDWVMAHPQASHKYRVWATTFEDYLSASVAAADRVLGVSSLADFAEILAGMTDEQYAKRGEAFGAVRLIHARAEDILPRSKPEEAEKARRQAWVNILKSKLGAPV
jgi:hypothetical protein